VCVNDEDTGRSQRPKHNPQEAQNRITRTMQIDFQASSNRHNAFHRMAAVQSPFKITVSSSAMSLEDHILKWHVPNIISFNTVIDLESSEGHRLGDLSEDPYPWQDANARVF